LIKTKQHKVFTTFSNVVLMFLLCLIKDKQLAVPPSARVSLCRHNTAYCCSRFNYK